MIFHDSNHRSQGLRALHDITSLNQAVANFGTVDKYLGAFRRQAGNRRLAPIVESFPARQSPQEGTMTLPPFQTLYFEDLSVGMTESYSKTVKSSDVVGFAEITGDRNPIHLSEHFAAKTPFKGRIAHGLYTAGLISAVIGTRLPGPGAIYVSQTLKFLAPVKIGDTVDATVEVVELIEQRQRARLSCQCKVGNTVVLEGEAIVKIPRRPQGSEIGA
jgi:3-hydroxybutyryl-CoA dehydratase